MTVAVARLQIAELTEESREVDMAVLQDAEQTVDQMTIIGLAGFQA